MTEGKRGEAYLDRDLNSYWDRGVVVKRRAGLDGAPEAVLVVGGLARYRLIGDHYAYQRFLTTYNEYEGLPAPDVDALTAYVVSHLNKVFVGREHRITEIGGVAPAAGGQWIWHSATSFTVPFEIGYKQIKNDTTIEEREDLIDIRFYRGAIDAPLSGLLATEKARVQVGTTQHERLQIQQMKTLRDGLQVRR